MKKLIIALILSFPILAIAQQDFLDAGFKLLKDNKPAEAFKAWSKGGPVDGTKELEAQSTQLGQVQAYFGNFVSHEYISEVVLSQTNKVTYAIMNFDKGALYMRFLLYKLPDGNWTSPSFRFNSAPENIWPREMLVE